MAKSKQSEFVPIELELFEAAYERHLWRKQIFGEPALQPTNRDSYTTFHSFSNGFTLQQKHYFRPYEPRIIDWKDIPEDFRKDFKSPDQIARLEILNQKNTTVEPILKSEELDPELRTVYEHPSDSDNSDQLSDTHQHTLDADHPNKTSNSSKRSLRRQQRILQKKELRSLARKNIVTEGPANWLHNLETSGINKEEHSNSITHSTSVMSSETSNNTSVKDNLQSSPPAQHKPLVVGRTKPRATSLETKMDPVQNADAKAAFNHEIEENLKSNVTAAGPADNESANNSSKKKEKAPKQPKPPKAAPPPAPLSPALIDLRVGHILRAINHPNADSLYVSTIAMGDAEGTEHTQIDEETGKVVRTVCSGLNGLIPLAEMQDRKIIVVANLKPVNMRSIKSAAMVLAASPKAEEGADPHAPDRVVELVSPPEGSEAGDNVYFEGWPYGEGKGPEKQLNPKKKQWEAIQPGFYTSDDLVVGFDAGRSEIDGDQKGDLVVEGKGKCTVKTLKGAVVR